MTPTRSGPRPAAAPAASIPAVLAQAGRWRLALLLLVFLVSLPAVTTRIYATDEIQYFSYLRSLWWDHDVDFENEYRSFYEALPGRLPGFHETHLERETATGRRLNFGTIGSALLWAPFYAAGDLWVLAHPSAVASGARDGYSHPYVAAVCYGSAFYGLGALVLSWVAAARLSIAPRPGWLALAAIWIGSPLLFYMYVAPVMAHATAAFAVALFVVTWLQVRTRWSAGGAALLGLTGALMVMVREQDVVYLCGPGIDYLWLVRTDRAERRRLLLAAATGAGAFAAAFAPQALAYLALNGRIGPSPLVGRKMDWMSPHAVQVLFSPEHGFLFWTPLAALAVAGLIVVVVRLWRAGPESALVRPRAAAAALIAMLAAQIYVLGAVASWTQAGAFGQRRFVSATVLLVVGLGGLLSALRPGPARITAGLVLAVCIWWNLAMMALFGAGLMDRQRLELGRNAYDVFVTIPRMAPELAYRYLFDRASFYRQPAAATSE